ncbi:MAG: undecaprenyl-diphosphate phosphatase [Saprospiraceae bacterium]|nr:undecaprenyl-diphosphate phosphatase [Saprospiraceae bacterium]MBK6566118.1 undecaprenyl-diphosphate phosphatase [Saprospiraceae bacterium]MBK8080694.1 undecaprenyl-diphosphate phosphatase [Saprospiraceae bacterium]MBK8369864.1 undecaprenyl-diphosphate phosphatase [Saprospiraceae bacterium]MBK8548233.1 undecaprenyl-diphosphate phosphatase [Saprospiraceae bacterium]
MEAIIEAIILGIVQGLTEFLPVSSSGHLELGKFLLGDESLPQESLLMTVVLHFATAMATLVVFRKDIIQIIQGFYKEKGKGENSNFVLLILISMVPATLVGLFFEKEIEGFFNQNIILVCSMLLITGFLLLFTYTAKKQDGEIGKFLAFIIGISQAIAILPGISRSGATISTALYLGINKEKAARFSFLMVVPLIFGKMSKDVLDNKITFESSQSLPLLLGGLAAFITGYFACTWMIQIVKSSKLTYFAYYCFAIGGIGLALALLNGN